MTTTTKAEVKSWASILDERTREQAHVISRAPGVAGHLALMPDAHLGIGATVGSVIPTYADTIIPAAVGVDIGCGMMACRTDIDELPDDLTPLVHQFGRSIPAGVGRQHRDATEKAEAWFESNPLPDSADEVFATRKGGARRADRYGRAQLGTLGSGNHFVEVCLDREDAVWCLLHSGSRGIGNAIAQIFIDIAKSECTDELEDPDTARLTGKSFEKYIEMMEWAQRYAFANRELMMDAMIDDVTRFIGDVRGNRDHQLSSQLRGKGAALWPRNVDHPQGSDQGRRWRHGHHSRLYGSGDVHRGGQGLRGLLQLFGARSGANVQQVTCAQDVQRRVAP